MPFRLREVETDDESENREENTANTVDHDECFLIYSNASCVTGRKLGDYLGIPHGKSLSEQVEYLIRWGSSRGVTYIPNQRTLNRKSRIEQNTNKLESLRILDRADIPVPNHSRVMDGLEYPILGRETNHREGRDINLILQERDDTLTSSDFYVQYMPVQMEYRVHVAGGEILKLYEKRLRSESDNHPFIRNSVNGSVFLNPRDEVPPEVEENAQRALDALELEFGAADVIYGEDGEVYVLEVNTAPSLDEANIERYGQYFAQAVGLAGYPGMANVELNPEEPGSDEDAGEAELLAT